MTKAFKLRSKWLILTATMLCALAGVASSARSARAGVVFRSLPSAVFEGQKPTFWATAGSGVVHCAWTLAYPGGRTDSFAETRRDGHAAWSVRIPAVPPGQATIAVRCGSAGSARASILIKWATQAPAISIDKRGFTQRNDRYGTGSSVGWGAVVRNKRTRSDASEVRLLINFVDSANKVLGSAHASVGRVPLGSTFYAGGEERIDTQAAVAHLEIVVQAVSSPPQAGTPPLVSDVVFVPATGTDPGGPYLDSIRGQILNNYRRTLDSATLGVVVLDAHGNILGGGSGYASGPVSYGAREYFTVSSSFSTIVMAQASTMLISPVASFPTSG